MGKRGFVNEITAIVIVIIILAVLVWIVNKFIFGGGMNLWESFKQILHFGS